MFEYPAAATAQNYPLIKGGQFYPTRRNGKVLGIGLHVTAGLQDLDGVDDQSAEGTNRWGAAGTVQASWHCCLDSDSIAPALPDWYTAWHIQGYNSRTWGLEISNRDARWDNKPDAWVRATIRNAARACAPIVVKYGLPLRLATKTEVDAAIAKGVPFGFAYHMHLNPLTRRDPGATFPLALFFTYLRQELAGTVQEEDDMEPKDLWAYPINISGSEYSGKNPMPAREMLSNAAKFSMYNHNFMRYRLPAAVAEMVAGAQDPAVFAKAVAAELRDDLEALTEAVRDSGAGATAQQIVDEFVRRLVDQPQGQE